MLIPRKLSSVAFLLGLAVSPLALGGCGADADQLRARAAFDMKCPESQIKMVQIDSSTQGVEGCGSRSTYVESCDAPANNLARNCTWVKN